MSVKAEALEQKPTRDRGPQSGMDTDNDRTRLAASLSGQNSIGVGGAEQSLFIGPSSRGLIPNHVQPEALAATSKKSAKERPIADVSGGTDLAADVDGSDGQDTPRAAETVVVIQDPAEPAVAAGSGEGLGGGKGGKRPTGGGGRSGDGGHSNESGQPQDSNGDENFEAGRAESVARKRRPREIAERETVTDTIGEGRVQIIESAWAVLEIGQEITDKNMKPHPAGDGILTEGQAELLTRLLTVRNRLFYDKDYAEQGVEDLAREVQPAFVEMVDTYKSHVESDLERLREARDRIKTEVDTVDIDAEAEKMLEAVSNGRMPESDEKVDDGIPFLRASSQRMDVLIELIKATPRARDMDEHNLAIDAEKRLWLLDAFTTGAQKDPKRLALLFNSEAEVGDLQPVVIPSKDELNGLDLRILAWNEYINAYNVESMKRRERLTKAENERRAQLIAELAALGMNDQGVSNRHRSILTQRQNLTDVREAVNAYEQETETFVPIVAAIRDQVETMVTIPAELMLEELQAGKTEINGLADNVSGPQDFVVDTLEPLEIAEDYLAEAVKFMQDMKGGTLDLPLDKAQRAELNQLNERPIRNRRRPLLKAREARQVPALDSDFITVANATADILMSRVDKRDQTVKDMERGLRESDPRWEIVSPAERGILIALATGRMNTETMEEIIIMQQALAAVDQGGEQIQSYRREMSERYVALDTFKNTLQKDHPDRLQALVATVAHLEQLLDNGSSSKEIISALLGWENTDDAAKRRTAQRLLGSEAVENPVADLTQKLQADIKNIRRYLDTGELAAGDRRETSDAGELGRLDIPGFKDQFSAEHAIGEKQPVTEFTNEELEGRVSEVPSEIVRILGPDRVRVLEVLAVNLQFMRETQAIPKPLQGDPEDTIIPEDMQALIQEVEELHAKRHRTQQTDGWISLRTRAIAQQLQALSTVHVPEFVAKTASAKSKLEALKEQLPPRLKDVLANHQEAIHEIVPNISKHQERVGQLIDEIIVEGAGIDQGEHAFIEDPRIILKALYELGRFLPSQQLVDDLGRIVTAEHMASYVDTVVTGLRKHPDAINRINAMGDPSDFNSVIVEAILEEVIPLGATDGGVRSAHRREASERTDINTWNETLRDLQEIEINAAVMYYLLQQRLSNYTEQPINILANNLTAIKKSLIKEAVAIRGKDQRARDQLACLEAVEAYVREKGTKVIETDVQFGFVITGEDRIVRTRLTEMPIHIRRVKLDQGLADLAENTPQVIDATRPAEQGRSNILDTIFDGSQNELATAINTQINGDLPDARVRIRQSDIGILTALATDSFDADAFMHEVTRVWQTSREQMDPAVTRFMQGHTNAEAALSAAIDRLRNLDDTVKPEVARILADNGHNFDLVMSELEDLQLLLVPAEPIMREQSVGEKPAAQSAPESATAQAAGAESGAGHAADGAEQQDKPAVNEPGEAHVGLATRETVDLSRISPDVITLLGDERVLEIEWLRRWFDEAGVFRNNDLFERRHTPHTGYDDRRAIERALAVIEQEQGKDAIRPIMIPSDLRNAKREMQDIAREAAATSDMVGMGEKGRKYHEKLRAVTESEMAMLLKITGSTALFVGNIDTLTNRNRTTITPEAFLDEATAILGRLQHVAGWLPTEKTLDALKEALVAERTAIDMGVYQIGYELADESTQRTYDALIKKMDGLKKGRHQIPDQDTQEFIRLLAEFKAVGDQTLVASAKASDATADQKRTQFAVRTDISRLDEASTVIVDREAAMKKAYGDLKDAVVDIAIDQINPLSNRLLTLYQTVLDLTPASDDTSSDAKAMLQALAVIEGYVAGHAHHLLASEKPMGLKMPERLKETLQVLSQHPVKARLDNWDTMLRDKAASAEPVKLTEEVITLARNARIALNAGFDSKKEPEQRELLKSLRNVRELTSLQRWLLVKIASGNPGPEMTNDMAGNLDAVRNATTRFLARDPQFDRLQEGQQTETSYQALKNFAEYCNAMMRAQPDTYQTVTDVLLSIVGATLPANQRNEIITSLAGRGAGDTKKTALGQKLETGLANVKEYLERKLIEEVQVFPSTPGDGAAQGTATDQVREQVAKGKGVVGETVESTAQIGEAMEEKAHLIEVAERAKATLGVDITLVNDVVGGGIDLQPTEEVLQNAAEKGILLDIPELAIALSDLYIDAQRKRSLFQQEQAGLLVALVAGGEEYFTKIEQTLARINTNQLEDEDLKYLESVAGGRGPTIRKLRAAIDFHATVENLDDLLRDPVWKKEYLNLLTREQFDGVRKILTTYLRPQREAVVYPRNLDYGAGAASEVESEDATDEEPAGREGEVRMKVVPAADLKFFQTLMDNVNLRIVGPEKVGLLKEVWTWKRKTFSALEPDEMWGEDEQIREIAPDEHTDMPTLQKRLLKDLTKGEKSKLESGEAKFVMERIQWLFDLKEQFPDIQYFQSKRPVLGGSYLMAIFQFEGRTVCLLENPTSRNATYIIMEEVLEEKGRLQSTWEDVAATHDKKSVRSEELAIRIVHARLSMEEEDELEDHTPEAYEREVMKKHNGRVFGHMDIKLSEIREGYVAKEPTVARPTRRRATAAPDEQAERAPLPIPKLPFDQVEEIIRGLPRIPTTDLKLSLYLGAEARQRERLNKQEQAQNDLIPDFELRYTYFPDRPDTQDNFLQLFKELRAQRLDSKSETGPYLGRAQSLGETWRNFLLDNEDLLVKFDEILKLDENYAQLYDYYRVLMSAPNKNEADLIRLNSLVDNPLGLHTFRIAIDRQLKDLLHEAYIKMNVAQIVPTSFYTKPKRR